MIKRVVTSAVLGSMLVAGCKPETDVEAIRQALPEAESVQINVPASGARVLGETAKFYAITRSVSVDLNRGAAGILLLVRTIVAYPVTSTEGDVYIWGPWTEALNPSEHRLTVQQNDAGAYAWSLEGRRKNSSDAFEAVVAGLAEPGDLPFKGKGEFTMDFDVAERLDPAGNDASGQLSVAYDLTESPRMVVMDYLRPETPPGGVAENVTLHYEYREGGEGGDFVYQLHGDLDDDGSAWEDLDIRSRWLASGAGRSDVHIQGGDLAPAELTGSECWDASFARVYWTDSLGWEATEGDPAACVFTSAVAP
jgi:hypothetical protein